MTTRLDDVNELLKLKKGDQGRLEHIKKALEAGTILFVSDSKYLKTLTEQYLINDTEKQVIKHNYELPAHTTKPKDIPTPKIEHLSENVNESNPKKTETDKITFCAKCGNSIKNENFCPKCGYSLNSNDSEKIDSVSHTSNNSSIIPTKRSKAWYLLPIFFGLAGGLLGIVGGLIAYLVLRKSDSKKARNCLIVGIVFTILGIAVIGIIGDPLQISDPLQIQCTEKGSDYVWHMGECIFAPDPCDDPVARAFGLCP